YRVDAVDLDINGQRTSVAVGDRSPRGGKHQRFQLLARGDELQSPSAEHLEIGQATQQQGKCHDPDDAERGDPTRGQARRPSRVGCELAPARHRDGSAAAASFRWKYAPKRSHSPGGFGELERVAPGGSERDAI